MVIRGKVYQPLVSSGRTSEVKTIGSRKISSDTVMNDVIISNAAGEETHLEDSSRIV